MNVIVSILCVVLLMNGSGLAHAQSKDVVIITNNWTSQIVLSHVYGSLLEQLGQPVRYVESSVSEQWGALSHGAAHVQLEVWEGTMNQEFNRLTNRGRIHNMGTHEATTREDWWYPSYVEKVCPGLPQWQALKGCAGQFAHKPGGKGVYVAGPWEKPDEARIRALELNFKVQQVENGDDLWVALKNAFEQKRPIILFNWSPNWVESRYEGKFVEFPLFAEECESDPEWGVNPNYLYDCGNPKGGWLKKAAWPGLEEFAPCAHSILRTLSFNNAQIAEAAAYVDVDALTHREAAQKWMENNRTTWQPWAKACVP